MVAVVGSSFFRSQQHHPGGITSGMGTMDQSLAEYVRQGKIAMKTAIERCANADDLRRLAGEG